MKRTAYLAFTLCLLFSAGVALGSDAPVTLDEIASLELTAPQSMDETPAVAAPEEAHWVSNNGCGTCGPAPVCDGRSIYAPCWEFGQGWGSCNYYLGVFCSDGSGWDCDCYQAGQNIP